MKLLPQASTVYPCGGVPVRTTAVRVARALPGPAASAVIRTVSASTGAARPCWTAGWPAGDDPIVDGKASTAATTGSVVAGFGSGGPNNVKCGRIAVSTAGVTPSTRPSSPSVSNGAPGGP